MDVFCSLLLGLIELQGNTDEKGLMLRPRALGKNLVLTISGKSLNLFEPILSAVNGSNHYLSAFGDD